VSPRKSRPARRPGRRRPGGASPLVVFAVSVAGLALLFWALSLQRGQAPLPAPVPSAEGPSTPRHLAGSPVAAGPAGSSRTNPSPGGAGKGVLIIIDDLGHNRAAAAPFIGFDRPLALAILPGRPRTAELAEEAHAAGKSVLLHLPLEPVGYPAMNPGDGCLLTSMPRERALQVLRQDLDSVPHAEAVSSHEGSRATADEPLMETVLGELARRDLAFVDSLTSRGSVTRKVARRLGARRIARDVFLDNDRTPGRIRARADELFRLVESRGWAVGIGHPYPETADALPWLRDEARRRGLSFLTLREALSRADAGN